MLLKRWRLHAWSHTIDDAQAAERQHQEGLALEGLGAAGRCLLTQVCVPLPVTLILEADL
jgi:hypothetical protein